MGYGGRGKRDGNREEIQGRFLKAAKNGEKVWGGNANEENLGNGVGKDLDKAAEWYRKSLDAGYEPVGEDQKHVEDVLGKQKN